MTILFDSIRWLARNVWGETFGTPVLYSVIATAGTSFDSRGQAWVKKEAVGFKVGLFSDVYTDVKTLLAFEPRYREKLDKFARKCGMTIEQLLGVS